MVVSLYTSRAILEVLGVEDYGIYNVVGGVVTMFNLFFASMSSAISRFITFELGLGAKGQLPKVFSTSLTVQLIIATAVVVMAEIGGVWFLNHKMVIPPDRLSAANWVLQCSIFTMAVNIFSVPYNAIIVAHERMKAFAYIGILEVLLRLCAVLLLFISTFDKLKIYAVMILGVSFIIRFIYTSYCRRNFAQSTKFRLGVDRELFRRILGFAGWNVIGASSAILRDQGVNIAINLFFGPAVNAARGISAQVNAAVISFISNFTMAINPQITKSYASGDHKYMMNLLFQGARFSFYALLFMALPVLIETPWLLGLWLKNVPEYSIIFVRLALVMSLSESLSGGLITAMLATGNIRNYQIVVGICQMLNFPISYLLLWLGAEPYSTMVVAIVISQICLALRLYMLRGMIGLSARGYLSQVYFNVVVVAALAVIAPVGVNMVMDSGFLRVITVSVVSVISSLTMILYVGCSRSERQLVYSKVQTVISNLYGRYKR